MRLRVAAGAMALALLPIGLATADQKAGASQRASNTTGMHTLLSAVAVIGPAAGTAVAIQQTGYFVAGVTEQSGGTQLVLRPVAGGVDVPVEVAAASTAKTVSPGTRVEVVKRPYGSALISADGVVLGIFLDSAARDLMYSSRSMGR